MTAATAVEAPALLAMTDIDKSFPGVHALRQVGLALRSGEVLALVGENGAGKSTLIKVLGGAYRPDGGTIRIDGRPVTITRPTDAQRAGVAVMYQEFNLVAHLSARENIFLGREQTRGGFVRRRDEHRRARQLFDRIGVAIDPETPCAHLTVARQQVVEIAKALAADARIIVMDEPSAALTMQEVDRLFEIIGDLKRQGIGVIYISHRLDEVFRVADRVMVMRDGAHVATRPVGDLTRQDMIEMMVGRTIEDEFPKQRVRPGAERLRVEGLNRGDRVRDVSFSVRSGEVVALTGLVGAGRTETARLIFGADRMESGTVSLDGRRLRLRSPRDAMASGICLLTEDRRNHGLVLDHSARANFALPNLPSLSALGFVRRRAERDAFAGFIASLKIKIPRQDTPAKNLSGGNQQKVVLAKWLQQNCKVIIFDEPTRGIDVGSKYEIYLLINQLAADGKAVLMISSELPEVLGMSDRILVMHDGRTTGEITHPAGATQEQILELAVG